MVVVVVVRGLHNRIMGMIMIIILGERSGKRRGGKKDRMCECKWVEYEGGSMIIMIMILMPSVVVVDVVRDVVRSTGQQTGENRPDEATYMLPGVATEMDHRRQHYHSPHSMASQEAQTSIPLGIKSDASIDRPPCPQQMDGIGYRIWHRRWLHHVAACPPSLCRHGLYGVCESVCFVFGTCTSMYARVCR